MGPSLAKIAATDRSGGSLGVMSPSRHYRRGGDSPSTDHVPRIRAHRLRANSLSEVYLRMVLDGIIFAVEMFFRLAVDTPVGLAVSGLLPQRI